MRSWYPIRNALVHAEKLAPERDAHMLTVSIAALVVHHIDIGPLRRLPPGHRPEHEGPDYIAHHVCALLLHGVSSEQTEIRKHLRLEPRFVKTMTESNPPLSRPLLPNHRELPANHCHVLPPLPSVGARVLGALCCGALLLSGCSDPDSSVQQPAEEIARPAKIVPVQHGGIDAIRTYPGTLEALKKADLAFRVQGQLIELPVKPGRHVKQGDLLARLDDAVYRNVLAEREAQFALVQIRYDQAQKLSEKELASQLELDQSRAELEVARALLNAARDQVAYTRLTAPFDGMVARVDPENYQTVKAQTPVIQLQDNDQLEVHFSVPESLVSQLIKVVDPRVLERYCGSVRFATRPGETFRACHKEFESAPDPLTRNYPVVFSLEPLSGFSVLPGMTVSIELDFSQFLSAEARSGLLAPVEAVFEEEGKT